MTLDEILVSEAERKNALTLDEILVYEREHFCRHRVSRAEECAECIAHLALLDECAEGIEPTFVVIIECSAGDPWVVFGGDTEEIAEDKKREIQKKWDERDWYKLTAKVSEVVYK